MDESGTMREVVSPIPRDRPDQQAQERDPLDIETMLRHALDEKEEVSAG